MVPLWVEWRRNVHACPADCEPNLGNNSRLCGERPLFADIVPFLSWLKPSKYNVGPVCLEFRPGWVSLFWQLAAASSNARRSWRPISVDAVRSISGRCVLHYSTHDTMMMMMMVWTRSVVFKPKRGNNAPHKTLENSRTALLNHAEANRVSSPSDMIFRFKIIPPDVWDATRFWETQDAEM